MYFRIKERRQPRELVLYGLQSSVHRPVMVPVYYVQNVQQPQQPSLVQELVNETVKQLWPDFVKALVHAAFAPKQRRIRRRRYLKR